MERFGDYEVMGSLGQGAMGVVLRVRHPALGVDRALKVLSQVTPDRLARFQREGRTLAEVRHPNVVAVHETGVRDGRPWFVMDLVEGRPLDEVLHTAGRLPVAQVLTLGAGLARGLAALHARGVVHRDLKPGNVLVRADGSPVIVDLGVALVPGSEDERLTRTGALVGTLTYMAPEQLLGGRASAASDVYALGAILFEAACGTPAAPDASSVQEFIARVVDGPTPRVGDVEPDLPAALDRLLVRVMARGAQDRPSAADVAVALEAPGLSTSGPAGARRRVRRLIGWSVAGAALAAAGVVGVVVASRPAVTKPPADAAPATEAAPVATSAAPAADLVEVTRALERALALPDPLPRRRALAGWLRAHPDEPRAASALAAWRATLREAPLAVWPLAPGKQVHGLLLPDGRALAWPQGERGLWLGDPWTGAAGPLGAKVRVFHGERDPRGGMLLVGEEGALHRLAAGASDLLLEREGFGREGAPRGLVVGERTIVVLRTRFAFVIDRRSLLAARVGPFENPREVALTDAERVLVVATSGGADGDPSWLFSVDLARRDERLVSQAMGARVSVLVAAADGQVLTGNTSGVLLLLDARTGLERGRFVSADVQRQNVGVDHSTLAHDVAVRGAAFVEGGRVLLSVGGAIGSGRGDLRCWAAASGRELAPPLRLPAACLRLDVARDERTVLLSLDSGALEVWAAPHLAAELDVDRAAR